MSVCVLLSSLYVVPSDEFFSRPLIGPEITWSVPRPLIGQPPPPPPGCSFALPMLQGALACSSPRGRSSALLLSRAPLLAPLLGRSSALLLGDEEQLAGNDLRRSTCSPVPFPGASWRSSRPGRSLALLSSRVPSCASRQALVALLPQVPCFDRLNFLFYLGFIHLWILGHL